MRFLVKSNVWAVLNDILWLNSFRHVYNKNRLEMIQYKYFSNAQTDYKSLNKHDSMQKPLIHVSSSNSSKKPEVIKKNQCKVGGSRAQSTWLSL